MAGTAGLDIGRRRLLFVGGKGGVGKTTIAAALAVSIADAGRRCLLVSTDPAHSLGDLFDRRIGEPARDIAPNLAALEIDPDAQADRYIASVADNLRSLVRPELYPEIERQLSLARAAPGAAEAALLDRMTELMDDAGAKYDVVVFDTAPVGHTLRLLSLPEMMAAWTDGLLKRRDRAEGWTRALQRLRGQDRSSAEDAPYMAGSEARSGTESEAAFDEVAGDDRDTRIRRVLEARRRRFQRARALITDAAACGFVLVLIPEPLPILESRKALDALDRFGVPVLGLVVNQVLPPGPLGDFFERRRDRETRYMAQIDDTFPDTPRWTLPLMPEDVRGIEALRDVASLLTLPRT
jgi:arsenite/tail-anchored protein-transporting ATPase